jgi:thymidylate synthase (FAD)
MNEIIQVKPSYEILSEINTDIFLRFIEKAARTCYKSEHLTDKNSHHKLVKMLVEKGHLAMIEHAPSITVKFIADRGFSHELVRHRLSSFAQESTRYVDYSRKEGLKVIIPSWFDDQKYQETTLKEIMLQSFLDSHNAYLILRNNHVPAEIARSVLPIGIKTEIIMTANLRQWKHIFELRTSKFAHPTIRQLMRDLLSEFQEKIPYIFDSIQYE